MKIIGLAGGSGTGKSTIAAHLEKRGGGHIDADRIGHDLLDNDDSIRKKILRYFGPDVFTEKGDVDRKKLGEMVFKDSELRKILNSTLHPPIIKACMERANEMKSRGLEFVVVDAALLLEVDLPLPVEFTIALRCNRDEQVKRLLEKGGITEEEIHLRLKSQANLVDSFYKADFVLDTGGELSRVLEEVDAIVDEILERGD